MNSNHSIAAVVLAAGKGTRMGSDLHKVLHEIDGKPMLAHVLDNANGLNPARTIVVVGAGREQIHAKYPDLETVAQEEQLGTAHAVRMAVENLKDFQGIVLVLYGDVPMVRSETLRALCDEVRADTPLAIWASARTIPRPTEDWLSTKREVWKRSSNMPKRRMLKRRLDSAIRGFWPAALNCCSICSRRYETTIPKANTT